VKSTLNGIFHEKSTQPRLDPSKKTRVIYRTFLNRIPGTKAAHIVINSFGWILIELPTFFARPSRLHYDSKKFKPTRCMFFIIASSSRTQLSQDPTKTLTILCKSVQTLNKKTNPGLCEAAAAATSMEEAARLVLSTHCCINSSLSAAK